MSDGYEQLRVIQNLVNEVQRYCPGQLHWIAKQNDKERDDLFGFVIGKGFACVTVEDALKADDALIRKLAAEILGYEVGSRQDYEVQLGQAKERISKVQDELASLESELRYLLTKRDDLEAKLQTC